VVSNREDAEEVVQDSFMKAFGALKKFKQEARFSTWLYRIVYNTALTKVGERKMKTQDLDDQWEDEPAMVVEVGPFDLLNSEDRRKYVHLAIDKLSKEDTLVVTLHYMGEKSVSEICEILDLRKSAVKMRLLRGRAHLERALKVLLNKEMKSLL
jgi:RNA polymerase sigma factor (sigma-70 family)